MTLAWVLTAVAAAGLCVAGCRSYPAAASHGVVLSIGQARYVYLDIVDPYNVAISRFNSDVTDAQPWRVVRADLEALAAADQKADGQLLAVRWPAVVQPWVVALATTEGSAGVNCDYLMASSGSEEAANQLWARAPGCATAQDPRDQDEVRELLNLPPAR